MRFVRAAALLAVCAPLALADVDLGVRSGDSAKGTISAATEVETFRIFLPAKTKVVAKAKGAKKFNVSLELFDFDTNLAASGVEKGPAASIATTAAATGEHTAVVTSRDGAATGDYSFSIKLTPPKTHTGTLAAVPQGGTPLFGFAVAAGTQVTITAAAAKDSPALPNLRVLMGVQAFTADLTDDVVGKIDRSAKLVLPNSGQYAVQVENTGPQGDIVVTVKAKPPRYKPRKLDVTAKTLGASGAFAVSRVIGPEGGAIAVPDLGGGGGPFDISGSAVSIPPGALPSGGTLFVGTAPPLDPSGADAPIGAPVQFGPDGTKFAANVTLKIPVDLAAVGGVAADVKVYTRDAKGKVTLVPGPYDLVSNPGFVTFPSNHFSTYVAAGVTSGTGGAGFSTIYIGVTQAVDLAPATGFGDPDRVGYVADGSAVAKEVRELSPGSALVANFAGGGGTTTYPTNRLQADLQGPVTSIVEDQGTVYVGTAHRVFVVDLSTDMIDVFAGDGQDLSSGNAGPATSASFRSCVDIYPDVTLGLVLVDGVAGEVRYVDAAGNIQAFAGGAAGPGPGLDNVAATSAFLQAPTGVTFDSTGNAFIAELHRVRRVDATSSLITTFSGQTSIGTGCTTSAVAGNLAQFQELSSIAFDPTANVLYASDEGCHAIYEINASTGQTRPVAGTPGTSGFAPDGSAAGPVSTPRGVIALDGTGFLFLDVGNGRIRRFLF